MIVYISIGNSDDKLTQKEWSSFWGVVNRTIRDRAKVVHGCWLSAPNSEYQNACWCINISLQPAGRADFQSVLSAHARAYNQDSIAWAVVEDTQFI